MKAVKAFLFALVCLAVFLLAGAATCVTRAKYGYAAKVRANLAVSYVALVGDDAFLQYNQAGGEQGKAALLSYLEILQQIQREATAYPQNSLHYHMGLTYMRLYRLELAANNPTQANDDLTSAQKEFSKLGWKAEALSSQSLIKSMEAREAGEAKFYNTGMDASVGAAGEKSNPSRDAR